MFCVKAQRLLIKWCFEIVERLRDYECSGSALEYAPRCALVDERRWGVGWVACSFARSVRDEAHGVGEGCACALSQGCSVWTIEGLTGTFEYEKAC